VAIQQVIRYFLYVNDIRQDTPWETIDEAKAAAAKFLGSDSPLRIQQWSAPVREWNYDPELADWVEFIR